jgi:hypothetical protein
VGPQQIWFLLCGHRGEEQRIWCPFCGERPPIARA